MSGIARTIRLTWHRLTDPHPALTDVDDRLRAKTLSSALVVAIPLLLLYFIVEIWLLGSDNSKIAVQTQMMLLSGLLLIVPYALSRTRYINSTILATISSASIIVAYGALANSPINFNTFYFLAIPMLFSGLLQRRATLVFIVINALLVATLMMIFPALRVLDFVRGPITFLVFMAFSVTIIAVHRDRLEKTRRADLTQQVAERTASLTRTNAVLEAEIERRSRSEASLKDEATFYHALFDKTNDAIFIMDLKGVHLRANKRAAEMLGYTVDEFVGMHYSEIVAPEEHSKSDGIYERLMNGDTIPVYERVFRCKDGTYLPVELNVALVRDSEGTPRYLQSAARDITQRRKVEEWLQQALENEKQLAEMRSRFFSMVSHEFRTPLSVILSSNEMLTRYRDKLDEFRREEHHERIQDQVQHLVALLDDVMLINKADANRIELAPEVLNLGEFCSGIVEELRPTLGANLELAFHIEGHHLRAVLDPRLLRRILTNLLSNAIKYSPDGGTVNFDLNAGNGRVQFRVTDHGIGIPLEDQTHLFEVFHRAANVGKIGGTGLGLVIVKQAVEIQGGRLAFQSAPGAGTAFTVDLPRELAGAVAG